MRSIAEIYKTLSLITPRLATATVTGTGINVTPQNDSIIEAVALVNIGAVAGTPDSVSCIVTIEQSATVNGTYTVSGTFPTATGATKIGSQQVKLDFTKPFVRAVATIVFVGGITPSIALDVILLVRQNNGSISNVAALS